MESGGGNYRLVVRDEGVVGKRNKNLSISEVISFFE